MILQDHFSIQPEMGLEKCHLAIGARKMSLAIGAELKKIQEFYVNAIQCKI
jgi:hypothetical protein